MTYTTRNFESIKTYLHLQHSF